MAAAILTAGLSCGEPQPEYTAPVLLTTDPKGSFTEYEGTTLSVKFTFDIPVVCPEAAKGRITAGDAAVTDVLVTARYVNVTIGGLKPGRTYTITIPEGCVCSQASPELSAREIQYSFSTRAREEVPDWESAADAVAAMGTGWNLGNTLDSNSYDWKSDTPGWIVLYTDRRTSDWETAWGQPVTKPELLQMFADAGFGAIRVPVTWAEHFNDDGSVDKQWMDRVEQVVKYVLNTGMYCILNVHHDTGELGWLHCDDATYAAVSTKYKKLWGQIAERFASYGDHLLFESFNEMLDGSNRWNTTGKEGYANINRYNADFVRTVRSTGGNNAARNLIVNTYAASVSPDALKNFVLPDDIVEGHLIAQVHSYAPYRFAFEMENPADQITVFDEACASEVRGIVSDVNEYLVKKGIPTIFGEYGATSSVGEEQMARQAACYVSAAKQYGIACFYWMALSDGPDRSKPAWSKPIIKDAILDAWYGSSRP